MDLTEYRASKSETDRIGDLMGLLPEVGNKALDVGARDGFLSKLLADRFASVSALDLDLPAIEHERIQCVKGDVTALSYADCSFDLVLCAEVLEHIPTRLLEKACMELARVSSNYVLIGVPFKQDIRVGRTTCGTCGKINPPWGHVNSFDESALDALFPTLTIVKRSFVGETNERTNFMSTALMDMAGNPYGTYSQDEPCTHCGESLKSPPRKRIVAKGIYKTGVLGHPGTTAILQLPSKLDSHTFQKVEGAPPVPSAQFDLTSYASAESS